MNVGRTIGIGEMLACAEREVALRRAVFAKRGMTPARELEIERMEAIAAHFRSLVEREKAHERS